MNFENSVITSPRTSLNAPTNIGGRDVRTRQGARLAAAMSVMAGLLLGLSGCSVSAQDEYYRIRSIVLVPEPGDGAALTAAGSRFSRIESGTAAALALGHAPGTTSDQISDSQ